MSLEIFKDKKIDEKKAGEIFGYLTKTSEEGKCISKAMVVK